MSIASTLAGLWNRLFGRKPSPPVQPKSMLDNLGEEQSRPEGWVGVSSDAILKFKYEPLLGRPGYGDLTIIFVKYPKQYLYPSVPYKVYEGLKKAPSKGTYYHAHVKQYSVAVK